MRRETDSWCPRERVAVFDNDGTLWCEKPIPIQLDFTLYRLAELAGADHSLADRQPYRAALDRDYHWLGEAMTKHYHGDDADLGLLMRAVESAFEGMTVQAFSDEVTAWLHDASHPVLQRPYLSCAYVPMIELLRYLEANGFSTYIASGGDRDFMRPFAEHLYGIGPERVIGSALGLDFRPGEEDPTCSTSRRSSSSMTVRRSRCGSGAGSADDPWLPGGIPMATSRCSDSPARPSGRLSDSSSCTTTPIGVPTTSPEPRRPWTGPTRPRGRWSASGTTGSESLPKPEMTESQPPVAWSDATRGATMPEKFRGTINVDIRDSEPDWTPFEPPKAPEGAPNVVYIVLDDVGFSAMSCYGGPHRHAEHRPDRRRRGPLHPVAHHRAVLAHPLVPADRPQPHAQQHGLHHRGRDRLPQRQRDDPARERHALRRSWASGAGTPTWSASGTCARPTR